jgi:branched-chain amino acid transport system substrate-binding protein
MAIDDFLEDASGIKVELISADHQNKVDIGTTIAREWYDTQNVDAIIDLPVSSIALAVAELSAERNKVSLISSGASSMLTREHCQPTTIHWLYDTDAFAVGTGKSIVNQGLKKWFFITADYTFGHTLEATTGKVVEEGGGEVLGSVRAPISTADFSSYLLQAMSSGADVIALANSGGDTATAIKQAAEFGITDQKIVALTMTITDAKAVGIETGAGILLTSGFYWDLNERTRAWATRFHEKHGAMPTMMQAGVYSVTRHYLDAVKATGTTDGVDVARKMKEAPYDDLLFGEGRVRADGRAIHQLYMFELKSPEESEGEWDLYKLVDTIDGEATYQPMLDECNFLK